MYHKVSVVIPAKDEESRIGEVVKAALKSENVTEVIVSIDPRTNDSTAEVASGVGAKIIMSDKGGFGSVFKSGVRVANNDLIFKTDGDISSFQSDWIDRAVNELEPEVGLIKTFWPQETHTRSVTALTVKPIIKHWCPELDFIYLPISGLYLFNRVLIEVDDLSNDWSFDLDLLFQVHFSGARIKQIQIPEIVDRRKSTADLVPMANEMTNLLHNYFGPSKKSGQKVMLVTAHPDDAEIWCGGTIAKTCLYGGQVRSIVVTGTQERQNESLAAAQLIKGLDVSFLGQNQYGDFLNEEVAEMICEEIHQFLPDIIITHHPLDFHVDHRRVSELTLLSLLKLGHINYPSKLYYCNTYFQKDMLSQTFSGDRFIDVSSVFELKLALIACHQSQKVEYYSEMVKAMDRLNGLKSGVEYAETFLSSSTHLANKASIQL